MGLKTNNFCSAKVTVKGIQTQATDSEEMSTINIW